MQVRCAAASKACEAAGEAFASTNHDGTRRDVVASPQRLGAILTTQPEAGLLPHPLGLPPLAIGLSLKHGEGSRDPTFDTDVILGSCLRPVTLTPAIK